MSETLREKLMALVNCSGSCSHSLEGIQCPCAELFFPMLNLLTNKNGKAEPESSPRMVCENGHEWIYRDNPDKLIQTCPFCSTNLIAFKRVGMCAESGITITPASSEA